MGNSTKFSPTEAIQSVKGLHRKKLYQMMKDGEISYEKHHNSRVIDASELIRVFGSDFVPGDVSETDRDICETQRASGIAKRGAPAGSLVSGQVPNDSGQRRTA